MLVAHRVGRYSLLVRRNLGWLWLSGLLVSLVGLVLGCLRVVISVVLVVAVSLLLPESRLLLACNGLEFVAACLLPFIALACDLLWLPLSNVFLSTSSSSRSGT